MWHNIYSPQHTYVSSSYRSNRLGLSLWDPYAMRRGGCLELYYCNMVEWFWWDSILIFDDQLVSFSALTLLWFGHRPVKIVPEMTYVSSGTLNPTHSLTHLRTTMNLLNVEVKGLKVTVMIRPNVVKKVETYTPAAFRRIKSSLLDILK